MTKGEENSKKEWWSKNKKKIIIIGSITLVVIAGIVVGIKCDRYISEKTIDKMPEKDNQIHPQRGIKSGMSSVHAIELASTVFDEPIEIKDSTLKKNLLLAAKEDTEKRAFKEWGDVMSVKFSRSKFYAILEAAGILERRNGGLYPSKEGYPGVGIKECKTRDNNMALTFNEGIIMEVYNYLLDDSCGTFDKLSA